MVLITQSLQEFFKHKGMLKELTLLNFGHTEVLTETLYAEYVEWQIACNVAFLLELDKI